MTIENLKLYFLNILQKRDYSEKELRDKAILKGFEGQDINVAIKELKNLNFLNDQRLAENLLENYAGKKGLVWLKQKLMLRKIDKLVSNTALLNLESEILPDLVFKSKVERKYKIQDWKLLEMSTKQKVARFILSQGFTRPFEIIKKWTNKSLD
jgi:regulatory protein